MSKKYKDLIEQVKQEEQLASAEKVKEKQKEKRRFKIKRYETSSENKRLFPLHPLALTISCGGVGYFPVASGTMGSLQAMLVAFIIVLAPREFEIYSEQMILPIIIAVAALSSLLGIAACSMYLKKTGKEDPSEIVIDEFAGQFITLSIFGVGYFFLLEWDNKTFLNLLPLFPQYTIALFLLFRFFDIVKPGPIGWVDRNMKDGFGVMLDDILAGIFAGVTFFIIFFALHFSGGFEIIFEEFFPNYYPR